MSAQRLPQQPVLPCVRPAPRTTWSEPLVPVFPQSAPRGSSCGRFPSILPSGRPMWPGAGRL
eukprot:15479429-Alexandrium_andersonii.AAC.1